MAVDLTALCAQRGTARLVLLPAVCSVLFT